MEIHFSSLRPISAQSEAMTTKIFRSSPYEKNKIKLSGETKINTQHRTTMEMILKSFIKYKACSSSKLNIFFLSLQRKPKDINESPFLRF
jgi:hypothetical protein